MNKKVYIFTSSPVENDNRILNEADSLAEDGWDVTVYSKTSSGLPLLQKTKWGYIKRASVQRYGFFGAKIIHALSFYLQAAKEIKSVKPDAIHLCDFETLPILFFVNKKKLGCKVIYDAHEYESERNGLRAGHKIVIRALERRSFHDVDATITVTESIADEYVALYNISRPCVIMNCQKSEYVETKNESKEVIRASLGIQPNEKLFIYQGILGPGRGIERLLDAFSDIALRNVHVLFMGDGPLNSKINDFCSCFGNIHIIPLQPREVYLSYSAAADFGLCLIEDVSLSDRYCLPNKLFEYIASGTPVLASDLPDIARLVNNHGIGKVLISNDKYSIIQGINQITLTDRSMYKDNLTVAAKTFTWELEGRKLVSIYNRVMME